MADIRGILQSSLQGKYDGFSYRVAEVPYDWTENGLDVSGRFFYLTFQNGVPTLEEFVKLLHGQLVPYCIPRQIRDVKWAAMQSDNDWRHATELLRQARDLFIRAGEDGRKASEVGELILFTLLEAAFGAPQLVCKMALKTSEAMPIHGADGIHVMLGRQQGSICFVWGEAKLYKTLSSALDAACTSIKDFVERADRRAPIGREIDIIRDHLDTTMHPQLQSLLLDALDPYTAAYNQREEAFACFVGFDYDVLQKIHKLPREERESAFLRWPNSKCMLSIR
jgi:Cap4 SAVED domain